MGTEEQEKSAKIVLDPAFEAPSRLGSGLLESACQICLLYELQKRGIYTETEAVLPVFAGIMQRYHHRLRVSWRGLYDVARRRALAPGGAAIYDIGAKIWLKILNKMVDKIYKNCIMK